MRDTTDATALDRLTAALYDGGPVPVELVERLRALLRSLDLTTTILANEHEYLSPTVSGAEQAAFRLSTIEPSLRAYADHGEPGEPAGASLGADQSGAVHHRERVAEVARGLADDLGVGASVTHRGDVIYRVTPDAELFVGS